MPTYNYNTTPRQRGPNQYSGSYYGGNYPSGQLSDEDYFRGGSLYSVDDPGGAFDSALRDYGINPFAANPFTQTMRRNAAPLATAYNADMALYGTPQSNYGNPTGAGPGNTTTPLNLSMYPFHYANYMQDALSGTGTTNIGRTQYMNPAEAPVHDPMLPRSGGSFTKIRNAMEQLPFLIQAARRENAGTSGNLNEVNPFLQNMMERLAEGQGSEAGMGTVNYLSQMASPLMSPALREAYRRGLMQRQQNAVQQFMGQQDPTQGDIWQFLGY